MFLLVVSTLQGVTLETYSQEVSESIKVDLRYKGEDLPEYLDYVFIKTKVGNVRKSATGTSMIIYQIPFNEKLEIIEKIDQTGTGKQFWYKVKTPNGIGYISSIYCKREFSDLKK